MPAVTDPVADVGPAGDERTRSSEPQHSSGGLQMRLYMAERELPGVTLAELAEAKRAVEETSRDFTAAGRSVRYLRSTFGPVDGHCMCLVEADDAATVRAVNETAGVPFTRIVEAEELSPS
jgi:hypothetical protein